MYSGDADSGDDCTGSTRTREGEEHPGDRPGSADVAGYGDQVSAVWRH